MAIFINKKIKNILEAEDSNSKKEIGTVQQDTPENNPSDYDIPDEEDKNDNTEPDLEDISNSIDDSPEETNQESNNPIEDNNNDLNDEEDNNIGSGIDEDISNEDDNVIDNNTDENELKKLDTELFGSLTNEENLSKNKKLKKMYLELFETITNVIERMSDIDKSTDTTSILFLAADKLEELREMITDYMTDIYDSRGYVENLIYYNQILAILSTLNKILIELGVKEDGKSGRN